VNPRLVVELVVLLWAAIASAIAYNAIAERATYRAEAKVEAEKAKAEAKAQTDEWALKVKDAEDARRVDQATIRTLTDRVASSDHRLRDAERRVVAVSDAACPAQAQSIDALAAVLGNCEDEYRRVVAAADGHVADIKALMAAWPK
jgi:hypothetical protein